MHKEFISYEQALALKELGFAEPCIYHYKRNEEGKHSSTPTFEMLTPFGDNHNKLESRVSAPLYQQSFRWFREKHELKIFFAYWNGYNDNGFENEYKYECYIVPPNGPSITVRGEDDRVYFDIYEEAELECLKQLIEIVKNKK